MFFPSIHAFVIVTAFVIVPIPPWSHHAVHRTATPTATPTILVSFIYRCGTRFGQSERYQLQLELFRWRGANQALQPAVHMVGVVAAEPATGACEAWDIDFGCATLYVRFLEGSKGH